MIDSYRTVKKESQAKVVRKKSRFISTCFHVESTDEVTSLINRARREYHDASHRCYAYRVLASNGLIEYGSDAGEPSGSAGAPILQQIAKLDLYNVLVIVVRYFGGTKLGIRGLIEAYGDTTAQALASADIVLERREVSLQVRFPPEITSQVLGLVHHHQARVGNLSYDKEGHALVTIPESLVKDFTDRLTEATGARAVWEEGND